MKKCLILLALLSLLLVGCNKASDPEGTQNGGDGTTDPVSTDFATTDEEMFTDRDGDATYAESDCVRITLNGDSATADSDAVSITGSTVVITAEATYLISGTLNNGQIVVNAPDTAKLQLVLDGVNIHSASSAPLYILGADKVFVTLAEGSTNTLSNGGSFTAIDESNIDGTLFSKQNLTLNGSGTLTVTSPAGHGIVCKDDLVITGGNYTVTAASHAIDANDSVRLSGATLSLTAGKDGIHAENSDDATLGFVYLSSGSLTVNAGGDGIDAAYFLQIADGSLDITSGTAASADTSGKGLKATGSMLIDGGSLKIVSGDDAVHSNTSVIVNGGSFEISSGDDGFYADQSLKITAGTILITKSYEGLEGLDIEISGGTVTLTASDDGINAAGGNDSSGFGGSFGGDSFGRPGGMGGHSGGGGMSGSSDGSIVISGGTLSITASGDGLDANGTLAISGGYITVCGPTQGDTATLDYDVSGTISGGTFIGTGAANMAQSISSDTQGVLAFRVGNQSAGTSITITDKHGNVLISHTPALPYAVIIISSSALVKGEEYTLTIGTTSETVTAS